MSIKIDAKNLIKIYGENTTHALELLNNGFSRSDILSRTGKTVGVTGVNFEIKEGEIFVFIGLSGSGKSTVLRCINGLLKPTRGSVCVDGTHIEKMRENISKTLNLGVERVSVKATTTEKMDSVGQELAIAAQAVCLLQKA